VTLGEMIRLVVDSEVSDWHVLELFSDQEGDHSSRAVFKDDLSISLCWGRTRCADFEEEWTKKFIGQEAASEYAELFFNGSAIFRQIYVSVDAGKGILPMPTIPDHTVPADLLRFAGLLNGLSGMNTDGWRFGQYVQLAGIRETAEPWPQL
jgi:hypothetical protein